jgi:hypothetical protein
MSHRGPGERPGYLAQTALSAPGSSRRVTVSPLANWWSVSTLPVNPAKRYTPKATPSTVNTTAIAAAVTYQ